MTFLQGCAQCLDQTRATPPSVQAAYRHAIELVAAAAVAIFTLGAVLLLTERRACSDPTEPPRPRKTPQNSTPLNPSVLPHPCTPSSRE